MGKCYQAEVEQNPHIWLASDDDDHAMNIDDPNCASDGARRILMAQWLSAAWADLEANHKHLIDSAFLQTGFLLAKDGSEDGLVSLQGWEGTEKYKFR